MCRAGRSRAPSASLSPVSTRQGWRSTLRMINDCCTVDQRVPRIQRSSWSRRSPRKYTRARPSATRQRRSSEQAVARCVPPDPA
eukprot:774174-Prymnesium_polylepis.1